MVRGLDIFCGGGGSSYGARDAGVEIVCAIDKDLIATKIFKDNFPGTTVLNRKLENVVFKTLRDRIGDIDLLLASPECTNHTCAKGSAPRSEESRATALQTLRYARAFKPRWLVMENVIHMRPWSRFEELKSELKTLGYNLREQILDSSDFGVPQKRRRLFIMGDRERELDEIVPPGKVNSPSVQEILDPVGTWKTTLLFKKGRAKGTLERAERAFANLGEKTGFLLVYYGSDGSGGWQKLDRPLRTVTTVDRFALVVPGPDGPEMRMLQVPELRRAMGFEDDFELARGTRRDKIRILGNGVCPPVMRDIVRQITGSDE